MCLLSEAFDDASNAAYIGEGIKATYLKTAPYSTA
jgi:hypothetical protein